MLRLLTLASVVVCAAAGQPCMPNALLNYTCMPNATHVSIGTLKTQEPLTCCHACSNRKQCKAWTVNHDKGTCHLWSEPKPRYTGNCTSGAAGPTPPTPPLPPAAPTPAPAPPLPPPAGAKNVLLLMIDDLRPELGAYGASWVHSPRIDALANRSMLFERAYTAVAVCGPARSAILTGRRPDSAHCWSLSGARGYWRNYLPNAASMPEYFKQHGYTSIGLAKLFHPGPISGGDDQAHSWSPSGLPYWHSKEQAGPPGAAG